MNKRQLMKYPVTTKDMIKIITEGNIKAFICTKGVPKDAVYMFTEFDEHSKNCYLVFSHPSFYELEIDHAIPIGDLVIEGLK